MKPAVPPDGLRLSPHSSQLPRHFTSRWRVYLAAGLIMLAGGVAYHNSFAGAMVLDDHASIINNPSLRRLWPLWPALSPPHDAGIGGRPLANLSFACNYAIGGLQVRSYHAFNLAIHLLAAGMLFGVVRRTLTQPVLRERYGTAALPLACAITLLWTVHPLNTQVVNYLSQRTELLMGLFYLLTLYGFIRGVENETASDLVRGSKIESRTWFGVSVIACFCGAAAKEVIVTAPVIVLLYDRCFVAGSFSNAWRRHGRYYLGLGTSWALLAFLLQGISQRGGGYGLGVSAFDYALTSSKAIVLYLQLALWPYPLVFDYGDGVVARIADVWPQLLALVVFIAGTVIAWRKWPALAFLSAWFFLILAPTTSVGPVIGQPIAESRMYLPLAATLTLAVVGLYRLFGRRSLIFWFIVAGGLGTTTVRRNTVYQTAESLFRDTIAKAPHNPRAHNHLGQALINLGRRDEAIQQFETALHLEPDYALAHYNLGTVYLHSREWDKAIAHLEHTVRLNPRYALGHYNLGTALQQARRPSEAMPYFEEALRLKSELPEARINLGLIQLHRGEIAAAIRLFEEALQVKPDSVEAHINLGRSLIQTGQTTAAITHLQDALRLRPDLPEAHVNLAKAFFQEKRFAEAVHHFEIATTARSFAAETYLLWGLALAHTDRYQDAIRPFETALQLQPDYEEARYHLAHMFYRCGQLEDAKRQLEEVLRLNPNSGQARRNLEELRAAKTPFTQEQSRSQ